VDDEHLDNPAGRLVAVLRALAKQPGGRPAREAWRDVLGSPSDDAGLVSRIAEIMALAKRAEAAVQGLPGVERPAHLLLHFDRVHKALGLLLSISSATVQNFLQYLTPEVIYSLEMCSYALQRNRQGEPTIDVDKVSDLVEHVRSLIDKIADDQDLENDVCMLLVARLRDVESALLNIRITGYARVEKAMDALTFVPIRAVDDKKTKHRIVKVIVGLWDKLRTSLTLAAGIAGPAVKIYELTQNGGNGHGG
jgi:hypothetical protein